MTRLVEHKWFTILVPTMTALIFLSAVIITVRQNNQANQAVANHTQTLNEIRDAVSQIKTNNQMAHAQTVKYINCVLVGITNSPGQSQALTVYQTCLRNAGIDTNP